MFAPLAIILVLGICYSLTIAPDLSWAHFSADGGDLIAAAATNGVPHPSGYPLYLILARGFQFIPVGTLAFRTNLLSAVCTLLTAIVLYEYLVRQLPVSLWTKYISFVTAIAYGLAPFVWGQALVTEVYALHGLLMIVCLFVLSASELKIGEWLRGFVFGIAATNHLTSIMMFPLLLFGFEGKMFVPATIFLKRCLGILSGLSLYLLLPVRAYFDPPINWGDASTLNGFFWLISGQLYYEYPFSLSFADIVQRVRAFSGLLLVQFTWVGALIGIYGLFSRPGQRAIIPTWWMGSVFLIFSVFYGSHDSQVNLLPVWLGFAIWIAHGLHDLLAWLQDRFRLQRWMAGFLLIALLIRALLLAPSVDASRDFRARDFINLATQKIPPDALVFVEGDGQIFALWYAQFALNQRADMVVVVEDLLVYEWYLDSLRYANPDFVVSEKKGVKSVNLIAANPNRAICYILPGAKINCTQDRSVKEN